MTLLTSNEFNRKIESGTDLIIYIYSPSDPLSVVGMSSIIEIDGMHAKSFEVCLVNFLTEKEICNALSANQIPSVIAIKNKKIYKKLSGSFYSNQVLDLLK